MKALGEKEPEPAPVNHLGNLFTTQVNARPERFEHIGAAALR
jgi:hypothetical protein